MKNFFSPTYLILLSAIVFFSYYNGFGGNEIVRIDYQFYGCFGSERSKLTIHKKDDDTVATFKIKGKKSYHCLLNSRQIKAINEVVRKVKDLKEQGGCTSVEYFIIYTKDGIIMRTDGACSETGFFELGNVLFNFQYASFPSTIYPQL